MNETLYFAYQGGFGAPRDTRCPLCTGGWVEHTTLLVAYDEAGEYQLRGRTIRVLGRVPGYGGPVAGHIAGMSNEVADALPEAIVPDGYARPGPWADHLRPIMPECVEDTPCPMDGCRGKLYRGQNLTDVRCPACGMSWTISPQLKGVR